MISREVFMDILAMGRNGFSIGKNAKTLGIHRKTVKRHLETNAFPRYQNLLTSKVFLPLFLMAEFE